MEWNSLSGPQQKLIRDVILDGFIDEADFDVFLADRLNLAPLCHDTPGSTFQKRVFNLLRKTQARGSTKELVAALQQELSRNILMRELPDAVRLAGAEAPERLNFANRGLEAIVSANGIQDYYGWSTRLAAIGRAVCRIEAPENVARATGILFAPDLVLTNYHAVEDEIARDRPASDLVCRFDFARDVSGMSLGTPVALAAEPAWDVRSSPYDEQADRNGTGDAPPDRLDYAVLRLREPVADRTPIALDGALSEPGQAVLIVQHPRGAPMALAIGKVIGTNGNGSRFRYDADTLDGSSGGGTFNSKLQLIALHHAGDPSSLVQAQSNQGIPIRLIKADLAGRI